MRLFLDACSIIYLFESKQQQGQKTRSFITHALQDNKQLSVSRLSFLECRVLPLKEKNISLLENYNHFFQLPNLLIIDLNAEVINIATELRAKYSQALRTPDALQLACALAANADQFLTGDKKLTVISEIEVVVI